MSTTEVMEGCYANRSFGARAITTFVLADFEIRAQNAAVLSQEEILERLADRSRAEIARILDIPSTRVTEMYGGRRQLKLDEARKLVDHYGLAEQPSAALSEPVARLAVRWVAQNLGVSVETDDPRLAEIALDLQALSEFAVRPEVQQELAQVNGFLAGRKSQPPRQATV
jgi:hypothetical protein